MRSSRRTTGQVAENSVVDNATDACSLRLIFATFLADSSTSLGHPYFYLIQSNGWKCLCLLTGLQKSASDGAIAMRATTPAVLLGREGGDGRRSADMVLPGQEGSGVRL
jgi:hypothetical protein